MIPKTTTKISWKYLCLSTIKRFCAQDMALHPLAQNEASMALVPKLGLKTPHKQSLDSCLDMEIINIFCVPRMGLGALTMLNEWKQKL